jgi:hypothetical protein
VAVPFYERALGVFARLTNLLRVWYRHPFLIAMPTLVGHRVNMRANNLLDTERDPSLLQPKGDLNRRDQREADGSYNDLACPWMGMAGARFGRNMPIAETLWRRPVGNIRAQSARRQPRALEARDIRAGAASQRAGAGVAAVHGARLAEPRPEPQGRSAPAHSAAG